MAAGVRSETTNHKLVIILTKRRAWPGLGCQLFWAPPPPFIMSRLSLTSREEILDFPRQERQGGQGGREMEISQGIFHLSGEFHCRFLANTNYDVSCKYLQSQHLFSWKILMTVDCVMFYIEARQTRPDQSTYINIYIIVAELKMRWSNIRMFGSISTETAGRPSRDFPVNKGKTLRRGVMRGN